MNNTQFDMVAKTFQGLEDVLRDELIALGAQNVETGNRMVSFTGDNEMLYRANFCLRTALRILKPIVKFTAKNTDDLYDIVRDIEWEQYLSPEKTFAIDSTVYSDSFTHSKFVTYRVKDGIVDHFTDNCGKRPSIRVSGADVMLNVHIAGERVTISLDSSGEPLNQRGWRVDSTTAPINEVLAAGIILKTGWRGECDFVDPMCGSGTFLIEAALIAQNIYPGIYRKSFAFERWDDYDADLFASIASDDSTERGFDHRIYGGDISPEAITVARRNIRAANLDAVISLVCKPFDEWTEPPADGILVTNPPYGERLRPESMEELFSGIGTTLKRHFAGYHAWIIGYRDEDLQCIGLKPSVKFPILNGALECSLREYVLFSGSYNDFREEGGSVRNDGFNRDFRPKVRHLSDGEWDAEASRFGDRKPRRDRDNRRGDFRRDDRKREFRRDNDRDDRRRDFRRDDRRDEGKREFRKDDRRRDFKRDDRPREFKRDDRRRDFRRDDRCDEGKREFRKDDRKRDFKRDDRPREFKRDDRRDGGKPREYRAKPATIVPDKGPKISADFAVSIDRVDGKIMRSRRTWMKKQSAEDTPADNADK